MKKIRENNMALLATANESMFMISPDKVEQFLEDRKKNVIPPEFLKKCLYFNKLMKRK